MDSKEMTLREIIKLAEAALRESGGTRLKEGVKVVPRPVSSLPDFSLNARAFFKNYGTKLSGPKKVVLVVAFIGKGEAGVPVSRESLDFVWSRNSGLLGKFHNRNVTYAKEGGWIDSPKDGEYVLSANWLKIFNE